jgi:anti-sigma regulatory factor (Ser/Thr protein kinase)
MISRHDLTVPPQTGPPSDARASQEPSPSSWPSQTRTFPARPDQVREARKFLRAALDGCPAADDAVLCLSELATNSVLHSNSRDADGTFTVHTELHENDYAWIEVTDDGGLWNEHAHHDGRSHGLDIVRELATEWGIDGDASTGWIVWARLDWKPAAASAPPTPSRGKDHA